MKGEPFKYFGAAAASAIPPGQIELYRRLSNLRRLGREAFRSAQAVCRWRPPQVGQPTTPSS